MKLCGFEAGLDRPLFLIAGPCTAESLQLCLDVAGAMREVCARLGVNVIGRHTALGDAIVTGEVFLKMIPLRLASRC